MGSTSSGGSGGGIRADRGGVAAGRDVVAQLVVTGGQNTFLVGGHWRLKDAYIGPGQVFDRVRLDRFTGRTWLEREVDRFLEENERGYFVLEARAGLGKTTFLAHLVKQRGWIHHFAEMTRGEAGVVPARENLAAQLIRTYGLEEGEQTLLADQAVSHPDFLGRLLRQAVERRGDGEKVVLVVDGLDEAGTRPGENVLGLPRVLPVGAFFIVAKRPVPVRLDVEEPLQYCTIEAEGPLNLADARAYLERAVRWGWVASALRESGLGEGEFVEIVLAKSAGVWAYLHFVLENLRLGRHRPLDLDTLPRGLWGYYASFWGSWRQEHLDSGAWDSLHLPVLATLAAVQEETPLDLLGTLAGIRAEDRSKLRRLLREDWGAFIVRGPGTDRYRPYHESLRSFFQGRDEASRGSVESALLEELAAATLAAHDRIAGRYLATWGGLGQGLPGLQDGGLRDLDGRYGLRRLAGHLIAAGREDDLHRLLRLERRDGSEPVNVWFAARDSIDDIAGYLSDVATAWRAAEEASRRELGAGKQAASIGLEIRCTLLTASLGSLATKVPPALLVALVDKGVWGVERAYGYARRIVEPINRASVLVSLARWLPTGERAPMFTEALVAARTIVDEESRAKVLAYLARLADCIPEGERAAVLAETLQAAGAIRNGRWRFETLTTLASQLPVGERAEILTEALAAVREIKQMTWRPEAFGVLATQLPDDLLGDALAVARAIEPAPARCWALAALAPRLPEGDRSAVLAETFAVARTIETRLRARLFAALAPHLPDDLLAEVLAAARAIRHEGWRAWTLVELADRLPEGERAAVLAEARKAARMIMDVQWRAEELAAVADRLPEGERAAVLAEAREVARAIKAMDSRAQTLTELISPLPPALQGAALDEALAAARAIPNELSRVQTLAVLATRLPEGPRDAVLAEALATARATIVDDWRTGALAHLADFAGWLPAGLLAEALATMREIGDQEPRFQALSELATALPERERFAAALAAARTIRAERARTEAVVALAPRVPGDLLAEALATARALPFEDDRAEALAALAPRLTGSLLAEALATARAFQEKRPWVNALAALAPRLPEGERTAVLAKVLSEAPWAAPAVIPDENWRAWVIAELAPHLPRALLARAGTIAQTIGNEVHRIWALAAVARHLPEGGERTALLTEALAAARAIRDEESQARELAKLAPLVPDDLLRDVLATARAIGDERWRSQVLSELAARLPERERGAVLAEALGAARAVLDEWERYRALATLFPRLPADLLVEALAAVLAIGREEAHATALTELIPYLPADRLDKVLPVARAIRQEWYRYKTLAAAASRLPEREGKAVFADALAAARAIPRGSRGEALAALAPQLPADLLAEALAATAAVTATALTDRKSRAQALAALAPRLPEGDRAAVLTEAFTTAHAIPEGRYRVNLLRTLARQLHDAAGPRCWELVVQEALRKRGMGERSQLLFDLAALASLVAAVGGSAAVNEVGQAVQDTASWFP